jgi:Uncharacterized conserved protein, contains double-stranded beta-helix domain
MPLRTPRRNPADAVAVSCFVLRLDFLGCAAFFPNMSSSLRLRSRLAFASISLALASGLQAAEPALDRLVPGDSALVFAVEDLPALKTRFAASPLGRAWGDEEVRKFLAPLRENPDYRKLLEKLKAETGHSLEELLDFVTGDILFTVPLSSLQFTQSRVNADALLILEIGENEAKLRELAARQRAENQDDARRVETTEDYNGATLHILGAKTADGAEAAAAENTKSVVWAIHEGRAFLASKRELVTGALDAAAAGGLSASLSSAPRYRAVVDRAGGRPDYVFFADFQSVYPLLVARVENSSDPARRPNAMGIEPLNVLKALGLDALGVVSSTGAIADDGSSASDIVVTYSEPRGVLDLLAYRDGPVARPDWVSASWANVSSQNFSVPDLYAGLEQLLDRISPMLAGMAMGQVKAFDRQLNIDLKRDLIGNFGPNIIGGLVPPVGSSATKPPPYDELEQFFAVSLADAATFERTLDTLKARFLGPDGGPLQKREYLGRTLHVFAPPSGMSGAPKGFAYAIADGWLLVSVGSASPLETALQRMNKPAPDGSFWERADTRAALADVPASAFSIQIADLPTIFASICALAVKAQSERGLGETPIVDASATPSTETFAKYLSYVVTHGERKADGFHFKSFTPAAPAK